jgi:hypothetical protein
MRLESLCILPFINEFETTDPDVFIIEVKFLVGIYRMTDINTLSDISGGDLIDISFKADGGIVVHHPLMPDKKYFIQFGFCRPGYVGMTA